MNKIIITGNLCKDIDLMYTPSNIAVVQNTVAVRNDYKNVNGEHDSEFINIVVWRQSAEFLSKYAAKGSMVLVEGRLTNRSYDKQDGTKGYITEVVAEKIELLNSPAKSGNNEQKPDEKIVEQNDPFKDFGNEVQLSDDDLPF